MTTVTPTSPCPNSPVRSAVAEVDVSPPPHQPPLVLASASPRRADLLHLAGFTPLIRPVDVDERVYPGEDAPAYVTRVAQVKAVAGARGEAVAGARGGAEAGARAGAEVVLAADTAVVVDGDILGKPRNAAEAAAMLRRLSGRPHLVSTGVAVICAGRRIREQVVSTEVEFTTLTDADIDAYVATGEPLGKAGAYAIQGRAAAFVRRIDGSWTNVVGLPLVETRAILRTFGIEPGPQT